MWQSSCIPQAISGLHTASTTPWMSAPQRAIARESPLDTVDSLLPPPESSSAAELGAALPSSQVIKAFNTTLAGTLSARKVGPITTTVLVAGDDSDAKTALIEAGKAGGVEAIDAGGLNRAREL